VPATDGFFVRKADNDDVGVWVLTGQNCNSFSSKDKFGAPWLQSSWNLIAVLGPLFSVFHCDVSDNISGAHFVDLLKDLANTEKC
jgi:hypothetical protein